MSKLRLNITNNILLSKIQQSISRLSVTQSAKLIIRQGISSVISYFTQLKDVPNSYQNQAGKFLSVNENENGLEFSSINLTDEKVKLNAEDTIAGYLDNKIIEGNYFSEYEKLAISITIADLYTLISSSSLSVGQSYRVTDFKMIDTVRQAVNTTFIVGGTEELLVLAVAVNKLSSDAYSLTNREKVYIGDWTQWNLTIAYPPISDQIDVSVLTGSTMQLSTDYPVDLDIDTHLSITVTDNDTGGQFTFNNSNKGTYWTITDGIVTLPTNSFPYYDARNVEYDPINGNFGTQEISIVSADTIEATTPSTTFNDYIFTADTGGNFIIDNYSNGAYGFFDVLNKGYVWDIVSGKFVVSDRGGNVNMYGFISEYSNYGDYDIQITGEHKFKFDSDNHIQPGTYQNEYTYGWILFTDEEYQEFNYSNLGTYWDIVDNEFVLLTDTHDLTTEISQMEWSCVANDPTNLIDLELTTFDLHIGAYLPFLEMRDIYLTDDVSISGSTAFNIFSIIRRLDNYGNDIPCDTRTALFRRYEPVYSVWNISIAYALGDLVSASGALYFCTRANTGQGPSVTNSSYWAKVVDINGTNKSCFLGKTATPLTIYNCFDRGRITGLSLSAGGIGYPTSTTFTATIIGGDGNGTVSATTNGSGVITSITLLTAGIMYQVGTYYLAYTQGSGGAVNVSSVSTGEMTFTFTPNLSSYNDFTFWGSRKEGSSTMYDNVITMLPTSTLDCCSALSIGNFYENRIKYNASAVVTISGMYQTEANVNGVVLLGAINNSSLMYVSNSFISIGQQMNCASIVDACVYTAYRFQALFLTKSFLIQATDTTIGYCSSFIGSTSNVNALSFSTVVGSHTNCFYAKTLYFIPSMTAIGCSYVTSLTLLENVYAYNYFYQMVNVGGILTLSCTNYARNNVILGTLGSTSPGGNPYTTFFNQFYGNTLISTSTGCAMYGANVYGNYFGAGIYDCICYNTSGNALIYGNIFLGAVSQLKFYDNYVSIYSNLSFDVIEDNNWPASGAYRNIYSNKFLGYVRNNTFTLGSIANTTFLGNVGDSSAVNGNTFNYGSFCISYSTVFPNFYKNVITAPITSSIIGQGFSSNTISYAITNSQIGNSVTSNTMAGTIVNSRVGDNVSSFVLPALNGKWYPKINLVTSDSSGSTTDFSIDDIAGTRLLTLLNNGRFGINTSTPAYPCEIVALSNTNPLSIKGAFNNAGTIRMQSTVNTGYSGANLYDESGTLAGSFAYGNTSAGAFTDEFVFASRKAATVLKFYQGGVAAGNERIRIDASANVAFLNSSIGFGTTAPSGIIHALHSIFIGTALFERSAQTSDTMWVASRMLATKTTNMGNGFGSATLFAIRDDANVINPIGAIGAVRADADNTGDLVFNTYTLGVSSERMRITSSGNVGIGTTAPGATLNVKQSSDSYGKGIMLTNLAGTNSWEMAVASGDLCIGRNSITKMLIAGSGNVGIGTISPSAMLETVGNIVARYKASPVHPADANGYVELCVVDYGGTKVGRILPYTGSSYIDLAIGDWNGGNPNIMLKVGGYVGIGVGNPLESLHASGKIRATTGFNFNGTDGVTNSSAGVLTAITLQGGIATSVTKTTPVANETYLLSGITSITVTNGIITAIA